MFVHVGLRAFQYGILEIMMRRLFYFLFRRTVLWHSATCVSSAKLCIPLIVSAFFSWFIDYMVFYAVSAIHCFNKRCFEVSLAAPHKPTLHQNPEKRSFACQGGNISTATNKGNRGRSRMVYQHIIKQTKWSCGTVRWRMLSNLFS